MKPSENLACPFLDERVVFLRLPFVCFPTFDLYFNKFIPEEASNVQEIFVSLGLHDSFSYLLDRAI